LGEWCGRESVVVVQSRLLGSLEVWLNECTYEPSDDSLLLVEGLERLFLEGRRYERILDVGTGTGLLALAAFRLFKPSSLAAVDVSPCSLESASRNLPGEALLARCDGASCIEGYWDLAIVNPPYLPLPSVREPFTCKEMVEASWSGGGVFERLIRESASRAGEILVVYSSLSPAVAEDLLEPLGFEARRLDRRSFFMEELYVVHAARRSASGSGPGLAGSRRRTRLSS
jgi:release factor glutamine methyltransferase